MGAYSWPIRAKSRPAIDRHLFSLRRSIWRGEEVTYCEREFMCWNGCSQGVRVKFEQGRTENRSVYCCGRLSFPPPHGGTDCESAHSPSPAPRARRSSSSRITFPGAYFRYHQHQPSLTSE